ncbi:MAG: CPBP family glutamic-type intramembrane protease [Candidatus Dormibacteria bacterium]|jgi:membrane protease YdiL (CAAX protease family)/uncharacterized RDD family membrane protein YckC
MDLAGLGPRLGAFLLDWVFIVLAGTVGLTVAGSVGESGGAIQQGTLNPNSPAGLLVALIAILILFAWPFAYLGVGWHTGATPAMRILNLRVVNAATGGNLSWARVVLRSAGYWWSIVTVGVGFLPAAFDGQRRAVADRMAGSLVVAVRAVPMVWFPGPLGWSLWPSRAPRPVPVDPSAPAAVEAPVVRNPWTWTDVLPVAVLFFPLGYGASWLVVKAAEALGFHRSAQPAVSLLENVAAYGATLVLIVLLVRWRRHSRLSNLGLRLPSWRWLAAGIPMGFAALVVEDAAGVISRMIFSSAGSNNQAIGIQGEFGNSVLLAVLAVAVVAPISEEIMFRGFIFRYLQGRLPLWGAVVASAVIFSAAHAGWQEPTLFLPIFADGLVLAYLCAKSGSIWPGVMVHMTINIVGIIAIFR